MKRHLTLSSPLHLSLPFLLALCCTVAAEDQPVPPPPPAVDPTAPAPPVPPSADSAVVSASTPAAETPTAVLEASSTKSKGNPAAAAAGRATAEERKAFSLRLELDGGYDSNVLREDVNTTTATDTAGLALGGELHGTWRAIREPKSQLNIIGDLRYSAYPDESAANLARASVAAFGLLRFGVIDPGAVLAVNRQWIDDQGAATIIRGTLLATRVSTERSHFDSLSFDAYAVDYDNNDDASGALFDVLWRHWWMPEAGNARRRLETVIVAGIYNAETAVESYRTLKPNVSLLYRMGERAAALGIWDIHAQASWELREYDEGQLAESAERQTVWQTGVAAERWFGSGMSAGPFLAYSIRESTRADRDYDRVQVGVRLIADW